MTRHLFTLAGIAGLSLSALGSTACAMAAPAAPAAPASPASPAAPALLAPPVTVAPTATQDWPAWGGGESRNMASTVTGLPGDFTAGDFKPGTDEVDLSTTKNVQWVAKLGSQSYGNPTVSGGRIFVGTNNDSPRDPRFKGDRSTVYCLDEKTGDYIWQLNVPKLGTGKVSRLGVPGHLLLADRRRGSRSTSSRTVARSCASTCTAWPTATRATRTRASTWPGPPRSPWR